MPENEMKPLPCPFCGGTKITSGHVRDGRSLNCMDCGAGFVRYQPDADARALSAWNARAPAQSAGGGEIEKELEALRKYAHEATIAITGLTGGGSEFFGKQVGDIYLADLPFCVQRIREIRESLFETVKAVKREALSARAVLTDTAREGVSNDADLVERIEAAICKAEGWDRSHYDANPGAKAAAVIAQSEYERGWKAAREACAKIAKRELEASQAVDAPILNRAETIEINICALPMPAAPSNVGTGEGA